MCIVFSRTPVDYLKTNYVCPRGVMDNASASEAGNSGSTPDGGISKFF